MAKLLIAVATHNRPLITELSLSMLNQIKGPEDTLIVYDDGSTAYGEKWLKRMADEVIRMPVSGGIERLRARNFKDFATVFREYDFLYTTDNDAVHDPAFSLMLRGLYNRYTYGNQKLPVCLYHSTFHSHQDNVKWSNDEVSLRLTAPGISQMYDREMAEVIVTGLRARPELESRYGYDYHFPLMLKRPFIQSNVSYLEHFARDRYEGGIHAANSGTGAEALKDFERDRAIRPTAHLEALRPVIINYILNGVPSEMETEQ
ncbi:glycosyltransferase family 2 protein [Noviherbaspirillum massiliense]|uniref:glycosyltransferase family 2 protein n=1 Tax=Noviherbaspirillum massiliense TaxID=1465823 RepID=UPI00036D81A4|nr:hypothetical protein [Noviherbaspirillum massiliense]